MKNKHCDQHPCDTDSHFSGTALHRMTRKGKPTMDVVCHQHPNMGDWPIGLVQQAGINLNGEPVVFYVNHCRK